MVNALVPVTLTDSSKARSSDFHLVFFFSLNSNSKQNKTKTPNFDTDKWLKF